MLATGGSHAGDIEQRWDAAAIEALDVPVLQAVCSTSTRAAWEESASGLTPLDAATQVAIPEFDGRLLGGVVSFKERGEGGSNVGVAIPRYVADRERCARVARLAVRHARLRATPNADKRIAAAADELPDEARARRDGGRARHAGLARSACSTRWPRRATRSSGRSRTATSSCTR